jgi:gamma-glutamylcyclotransferase (GGCT)/AIG2-like uncharacterized protein YtfP
MGFQSHLSFFMINEYPFLSISIIVYMDDDVWYFAYGSNLDPYQKENRTGPIREAKRARLPNYRFAFNKIKNIEEKTGYANVMPDDGAEVWGIIFRCTKETLDQMDKYEGAPKHYRKEIVSVFTDEGDKCEAVTYVAQDGKKEDGLKPTSDYLERIVDGARHYNLPSEYINEIEKLA